MTEELIERVARGDLEAAAKASGFDTWDDAIYWSNLAKQSTVHDLAKAFARHRIAALTAATPALLEQGARLMQEAAVKAQREVGYPTDLPQWAVKAAVHRSDYVCAWEDGSQAVEEAIRALSPADIVKGVSQ